MKFHLCSKNISREILDNYQHHKCQYCIYKTSPVRCYISSGMLIDAEYGYIIVNLTYPDALVLKLADICITEITAEENIHYSLQEVIRQHI